MERNKNWAYSIEDSDNWDKKLEARKEFVNEGFVGACFLSLPSSSLCWLGA